VVAFLPTFAEEWLAKVIPNNVDSVIANEALQQTSAPPYSPRLFICFSVLLRLPTKRIFIWESFPWGKDLIKKKSHRPGFVRLISANLCRSSFLFFTDLLDRNPLDIILQRDKSFGFDILRS